MLAGGAFADEAPPRPKEKKPEPAQVVPEPAPAEVAPLVKRLANTPDAPCPTGCSSGRARWDLGREMRITIAAGRVTEGVIRRAGRARGTSI